MVVPGDVALNVSRATECRVSDNGCRNTLALPQQTKLEHSPVVGGQTVADGFRYLQRQKKINEILGTFI